MNSKLLTILLTVITLTLFTGTVKAAMSPPPPPTTGTTPPCWPPPCVPIDGGISLLAIAGAAFAGKKLYDKKKKNSSLSAAEE